jgi:hypothetical protein
LIGAFVCTFIFPIIALPLPIVALVTGFMGLSRAKRDPAGTGRGMAIAGVVMGAIGILAAVGMIVVFVVLVTSTSTYR